MITSVVSIKMKIKQETHLAFTKLVFLLDCWNYLQRNGTLRLRLFGTKIVLFIYFRRTNADLKQE